MQARSQPVEISEEKNEKEHKHIGKIKKESFWGKQAG